MVFITVGRKVECRWEQREGTLNLYHDWDFGPGSELMVQNYVADNNAAISTPMTNWQAHGTDSLDLYVTREGNYPFNSVLTFNIPDAEQLHDEKFGTLNIVAPNVHGTTPVTTELTLQSVQHPNGNTYMMMRLGDEVTLTPGFKILPTVSLPIVEGELDGGPGLVGWVQLVRCMYRYVTFDDREIRYSTGDEYLLDEEFPCPGSTAHLGTGAPVHPYMEDSPGMSLPKDIVEQVEMSLFFKTYLMYKSDNPGSIWVTLGRILWDVTALAYKPSGAPDWTTGRDLHIFGWETTSELPIWTRNGSVINDLFDAESRRVLTADEFGRLGLLPTTVIKRRRNDYRPYVGTYTSSEGSWADYKRDFEKHFDCLISLKDDGSFNTWMLPEVAARAKGYRTTILNELAPLARWRQPKASYRPPFGWETDWLLYVAPLCFAKSGEDAIFGYWALFSDISPRGIASTLQAKLSRMNVTCDKSVEFGTYPVTFSRPLWEEDMLALADLPMVYFLEPKEHFGQRLMALLVYFPGHGDIVGPNGHWIGEQGASRIEGFLISPIPSDITLEYMVHTATYGDTGWFQQNDFIGGRGDGSKAVEGFAIRLTGDARSKYDLSYCASVQGVGETGLVRDGGFCGTRGQNRAIEAIQVVLTLK